jgi:diguanylate cyclase (GGDEF)-like protein
LKILIVDDSETSRLLLATVLGNAGYCDLAFAESAAEAFDILDVGNPHAGEPDLDLVLMDVLMPGMNGVEAASVIKSNPLLRDVPIIMVTVSDDEETLAAAFQAGAADYIKKPVRKTELRARVASALRLKEETDARKARERELMDLARRLGEANRKLEELSNLDGLTGVANRRYFDKLLQREYQRALREGTEIAVLLADVDYFKDYNDTYGHLRGDDCLKEVAGAITRAALRPGDQVARFGGEEFVVLLPGTGWEGAREVAERIQENVAALEIEHGASRIGPMLTISLGMMSIKADRSVTPESLVNMADCALYDAKRSGRNCVRTGNRDHCTMQDG